MLLDDYKSGYIGEIDTDTVRNLFGLEGADRVVNRNYIRDILHDPQSHDIDDLFRSARIIRERYFGNDIFLYGFVYFSTYCKNNCTFCHYRQDNFKIKRYRKDDEEIIRIADELGRSGVHALDLTMGEDPEYLNNTQKLVALCKRIKADTGLPIMISCGVLDKNTLQELKYVGVDWYALYQETYSFRHFSRLRIGQSFERRVESKRFARDMGMLVEEGILVGTGETPEDIVASFDGMERIGATQVRAMTYVPHEDTLLASYRGDSEEIYLREKISIALMRHLFPDRLIPASLDIEGTKGLCERLDAGANVVTSIIPPCEGLAGVVSETEGVEHEYRTVAGITPIIESMGLQVADQKWYEAYLRRCHDLSTYCRR